MKHKEINDKYLNKLTKDFDNLVSKDKMNINSLEDIMVSSVNEYEKELLSKKNRNGKKKDSI